MNRPAAAHTATHTRGKMATKVYRKPHTLNLPGQEDRPACYISYKVVQDPVLASRCSFRLVQGKLNQEGVKWVSWKALAHYYRSNGFYHWLSREQKDSWILPEWDTSEGAHVQGVARP